MDVGDTAPAYHATSETRASLRLESASEIDQLIRRIQRHPPPHHPFKGYKPVSALRLLDQAKSV